MRGMQGTGTEPRSAFREAGVEPCQGGGRDGESREQKQRPGPGHSDGGDKKRGERNKSPGEKSPRSGAEIRGGWAAESLGGARQVGLPEDSQGRSHLSTTRGTVTSGHHPEKCHQPGASKTVCYEQLTFTAGL